MQPAVVACASRMGFGNKWFEDLPLLVGETGGIGLLWIVAAGSYGARVARKHILTIYNYFSGTL